MNKDLPKGKPILCVDFDGVLHSYTSGWKGPRVIPDPPVDGAIQFLITAQKHFNVHVYSSRSRYFGGRRAMKVWLRRQYLNLCHDPDSADRIVFGHVCETAFADPWHYEAKRATRRFVSELSFPLMKPAAFLQIDDRAMTFNGAFPTIEKMKAFKPWNK